jgi:hypothetical protein
MAEYGNHIQAAMVVDGVLATTGKEITTCINICVETSYPYSIGIYFIDSDAIEIGRQEYKKALLEMKECFLKNEWEDYKPRVIGLPRWYL